jgi:REP element-mobilizing transposase RayT
MARQPRNEIAGSIYHVTTHDVAETAIVRNNRHRKSLVQTFAQHAVRDLQGVRTILDNHYHALIRTPETTLGRGMQYLNGTYAQAFNRRHERKGALFGGRYKSKRVETDAHLRMTIRYIALNGFNAGIADHPRADRWNSYPRTVGAMARWPFIARAKLLSYLGPSRQVAFRRLILLVEGRDIHRERRLRHGLPP